MKVSLNNKYNILYILYIFRQIMLSEDELAEIQRIMAEEKDDMPLCNQGTVNEAGLPMDKQDTVSEAGLPMDKQDTVSEPGLLVDRDTCSQSKLTSEQHISQMDYSSYSSDYSSEDEIPLKTLRDKRRAEKDSQQAGTLHSKDKNGNNSDERTDRSTSEESEHSDDSVKDPTFSIKEETKRSGVSHRPRYICLNLEKSRNKGWKKKPTALSSKKRKCPGRPKALKRNNESDFQKATKQSQNTFKAKQIILKYHKKNLEAILASNGLQRKVVTGDGNCFFNAVHESTKVCKDEAELRNVVCDYLEQNQDEFKSFLTKENVTDGDQLSQFLDQLYILRGNGTWSVDLADALPLATANALGRDIVIYSSCRATPVLHIQRHNKDDQNVQECVHIQLGYLKVTGCEHYDAVEALTTPTTPHKRKTTSTEEHKTPQKQSSDTSCPNITPRKQAKYISPQTKRLSRKRGDAKPERWKKNVKKNLRMSGKEYVSSAGQTVEAREIQPTNCGKCRYKCDTNIPEEDRRKIFNVFWGLGSYERQKDFVCQNVTEHSPDRIRTAAQRRRKTARVFSFQINSQQIRVCKSFFIKTLNIGEKYVHTALKSKIAGTFGKVDGRGKCRPHNKTPAAKLDEVRKHIESFPVVDAHYTRQDTNRKFLGCDLTIAKMYHLYTEFCKSKGKKCVGSSVYRKVFCEEYNFSFHVPKKDQCQTCVTYWQAEERDEVTEIMKTEFEEHQKRKTLARGEKDLDKSFAKKKHTYHAATFDLEAVLPVPCSLVSQVYYKRKLSCYNLSVYSLADGKTTCFMWNESEGKRGSCEIATCLLLYLKSLPSANHVCFFSDSCPGQNRNRFVFAALLHAVVTLPNINILDHKYLESGHTQMECDSVHSTIERAKRLTSVYVPSQWDTIVRMARRKNPYFVVPVKHQDILNFKPVAQQILPNMSFDDQGRRVQWMKIVWLQVRKSDPDYLFFKYSFDQEEFNMLKIKSARRGTLAIQDDIPKAYTGKLSISEAKKKDLQSLCAANIIPAEFHSFYENLACSKSASDTLSFPDMHEKVVDSDEDPTI
jgi:hypothetical protein